MVNLGPTSPVAIVHQTPGKGEAVTRCCQRVSFELSVTDRMTNETQWVTCSGPQSPCPAENGHCTLLDDETLEDHLFTQHDERELAAVAVRLLQENGRLTAHLNTYVAASYAPGVQVFGPDGQPVLQDYRFEKREI